MCVFCIVDTDDVPQEPTDSMARLWRDLPLEAQMVVLVGSRIPLPPCTAAVGLAATEERAETLSPSIPVALAVSLVDTAESELTALS